MQFYLDESGNHSPNSAVLIIGAVEILGDPTEVEQSVRALWQSLSKRRSLAGHSGFERFKQDGFHATYDPPEVANTFLEFLGDVPFRTYMHLTDRTSLRAGASDGARLRYMYSNLILDLLHRFKREPVLDCSFEINEELNTFFHSAADHVFELARAKGAELDKLPELVTHVVAKTDVVSMAIIDYVMVAVQRWWSAGRPTSGRDWPLRAFRQIEPSISVLLSLEEGVISSRKRPLH